MFQWFRVRYNMDMDYQSEKITNTPVGFVFFTASSKTTIAFIVELYYCLFVWPHRF